MEHFDWVKLLLDHRGSGRSRSLHRDDPQMFFEIGDRVRFCIDDCGTLTGTLKKINPRRARVRCGADVWVVPYAGLNHQCASTATDRRSRAARLKEVAVQARELMDRHGLDQWTLRFNSA